MKAPVKCECQVNEMGWAERHGGVSSVVAHQFCAAVLLLKDFKTPVVLPALPNRPWQHNPAEHSLRAPRHCLVSIRTHGPAIRDVNVKSSHEIGDFAQRYIWPLYLVTHRAGSVIQAVA